MCTGSGSKPPGGSLANDSRRALKSELLGLQDFVGSGVMRDT